MKKILFLFFGIIALVSCKQKGPDPKDVALIQQRDSLNRIIAMKDNEINDMMSTMNDIVEGFRVINEAEDRLTVIRSDEGASSTERIRENMQFIQQTMQQNRELINKLRNQLSEQVVDLNSNISTLQDESTRKSQTITSQDKQLNTAWFVYGTKKELKEQRIYDDGKVLQNNFNRDYFTKIDIRVDKEIRLYSRSAKILTAHPASSYMLTQDANKQYILRISNPQLFWSTSKYLVVMVK